MPRIGEEHWQVLINNEPILNYHKILSIAKIKNENRE